MSDTSKEQKVGDGVTGHKLDPVLTILCSSLAKYMGLILHPCLGPEKHSSVSE